MGLAKSKEGIRPTVMIICKDLIEYIPEMEKAYEEFKIFKINKEKNDQNNTQHHDTTSLYVL